MVRVVANVLLVIIARSVKLVIDKLGEEWRGQEDRSQQVRQNINQAVTMSLMA